MQTNVVVVIVVVFVNTPASYKCQGVFLAMLVFVGLRTNRCSVSTRGSYVSETIRNFIDQLGYAGKKAWMGNGMGERLIIEPLCVQKTVH